MKTPRVLVENLCVASATNGTSDMNNVPERDARQGARRDGLAAVAIVLLTASLIVFVVSRLI